MELEEGTPLQKGAAQGAAPAPRSRWTPLLLAVTSFGALALVLTASHSAPLGAALAALYDDDTVMNTDDGGGCPTTLSSC